jgi:hypothetical protein
VSLRARVLISAAVLFTIVYLLRELRSDPAEGLTFLYVLPVSLVALELGLQAGGADRAARARAVRGLVVGRRERPRRRRLRHPRHRLRLGRRAHRHRGRAVRGRRGPRPRRAAKLADAAMYRAKAGGGSAVVRAV